MNNKKQYYVTMTDKFMSGWGMAKNKTNKLIIECDTMEEAEIVEENAKYRSDMKYVNIVITKPYYNKVQYHTSFKTKKEYKAWFVKGAFAK